MTNTQTISCSAPGSLMLLGEHAVLHGRRALVCAIDQRITVSVFHCLEKNLKIDSALGRYEAPLDALEDHPDFRFVLDAVKQYPQDNGIELKIDSDFSSDIGFGSSAAVTVATHAALLKFSGRANSPSEPLHRNDDSLGEFALPLYEIFQRSLATIHRVQGRGSGADVAASVFGGVVAYRAAPLEIRPLAESFPLTAVYSGSKMKTVDVIRYLEERRALNADYFERIFDRMDTSVGEVLESVSSEVERDLREHSERARSSRSTPDQAEFLKCLGREMILNQKLMEEMGLCNDALAKIIQTFQTLGVPSKISGSGLGDCAIGLAEPMGLSASAGENKPFGDDPVYALQVDLQGVSLIP